MLDRSRRVHLRAANVYPSITACSPSKMSLAKKQLVTLASALIIMYLHFLESSNVAQQEHIPVTLSRSEASRGPTSQTLRCGSGCHSREAADVTTLSC